MANNNKNFDMEAFMASIGVETPAVKAAKKAAAAKEYEKVYADMQRTFFSVFGDHVPESWK